MDFLDTRREHQPDQHFNEHTHKASARQRAGRAGRTVPGTVYRLYPRQFFNKHMSEYDTPEMDRLPLERVVLRVKALGVAMVQATLLEALTPPPRAAVDDAVGKLLALGALKRVWPSNAGAGQKRDEKDDEVKSKSRASHQQKSGPTAEHDGVAITPLGKVTSPRSPIQWVWYSVAVECH